MRKKKPIYYAIYKPDADTKAGILLFKSNNIGEFVMVADSEFRYPMRMVKQDKRWVVWRKP